MSDTLKKNGSCMIDMKIKTKKRIFVSLAVVFIFLLIALIIHNTNLFYISSWEARKAFELGEWERISKSWLAMYEISDDEKRLCWHFYIGPRGGGVEQKLMIIDAFTGELIVVFHLIDN